MINIAVIDQDGQQIRVDFHPTFRFSAGEPMVRFDTLPLEHLRFMDLPVKVYSLVHFDTLEELAMLGLFINAIDNHLATLEVAAEHLIFMPYLPFSRSDRVCHPGESFGVQYLARTMRAMTDHPMMVQTLDCHSGVAEREFNHRDIGFRNVDQLEILARYGFPAGYNVICAPDAGAMDNCIGIADEQDIVMVNCNKIRSTDTGMVTGMTLDDKGMDLTGARVLICDDICDGGRTFIECSKLLKAQGAVKVGLWVTHGIFSKGLGDLGLYIDEIFTTDAMNNGHKIAEMMLSPDTPPTTVYKVIKERT